MWKRVVQVAWLYVWVLVATTTTTTCQASKHMFAIQKDSRYIIAPIGHPFGFLKDGEFQLTVNDFELSSSSSKKLFHAGFLLKRFDSEQQFSKRLTEVMDSEGQICLFSSLLSPSSSRKLSLDQKKDDNKDDNAEIEHPKKEEKKTYVTDKGADGILLSMKDSTITWGPDNHPFLSHTFTVEEEGLYMLIYQVCLEEEAEAEEEEGETTKQQQPSIQSTFELDFTHINYDTFGTPSYLTAGEIPLPRMFLYFAFSYFLLFGMWIANIRNIHAGKDDYWGSNNNPTESRSSSTTGARAKVYAIHHMMAVLLALKAMTMFFESVRYHYIRVMGHAEFWSFVYYVFAFLKGLFLFTVILLIGSGWSFVKPFLNPKEKKVIAVVLFLQVIDNIAVAVLTHETEGERLYEDWSAVLHLVDILCCCAVLFPIVWQINNLEQQVETTTSTQQNEEEDEDEEEKADVARSMSKLKLFRSFYLLVIGYIYFTRIVVFIFATFLGYKHTWFRYLVTELGTLTFYVVVGFQFRPMPDNPYLALQQHHNDDYYDDDNDDDDLNESNNNNNNSSRKASSIEMGLSKTQAV